MDNKKRFYNIFGPIFNCQKNKSKQYKLKDQQYNNIITYQKIQMSDNPKKRRKNKQKIAEPSYEQVSNSNQVNQLNSTAQKFEGQKQPKINEAGSHNKLKNADQQTVGGQSTDQSLPRPYQFLKFASPPLHTIFVPHFTVKSINFVLSIILIIFFVIFMIYNYTRNIQNKLTWNCSIFELQNKYYPRIRYGYQFWRVPISFFFHSNVAHFVLNIIGIQIYGYFIQWYYGKAKFVVTLLLSGIMAHFLSCVALPTTVSTMPSAFLYSMIALKIFFLYEYKDYKPLLTRRIFIYLLLALIFGINLIPIFVNNNVDFTSHVAGFVTGLLMGIFFFIHKKQEQTTLHKIIKFGCVALIGVIIIICIALMYGLPDQNSNYLALNENIVRKCTDPTQE